MMATWLDGIIDEQTRREQERRLLIVCPEPNEDWMEYKSDERRDMRELLRRPEGGARKTFYIHLRQAVRAFHDLPSRPNPGEEQDHYDLVRGIAFIDLKNTGGPQRTDKEQIMKAAESRQAELVAQIASIGASHIAVAGQPAQAAFDRYIRQHIPSDIRVCRILHPSWRYGSADEYYRRVQEQMASAFPDSTQPPSGSKDDPQVDEPDFAQAKEFIFSDIEREMQIARTDPDQLQRVGIAPGGGNFLAALGLLCYTEFGGKLRFSRKGPDGRDVASENFNLFFDDLGPPYKSFRQQHNVYDIFRCSLAHEYYVKKSCTIYMFGNQDLPGIGIDHSGKYWFAVQNYYRDLKQAFDRLEGCLFGRQTSA